MNKLGAFETDYFDNDEDMNEFITWYKSYIMKDYDIVTPDNKSFIVCFDVVDKQVILIEQKLKEIKDLA